MRINVVLSLVKNQIIATKPLEQFVSSASKSKNKILGTIGKVFLLAIIAASFLFLIGSTFFGYFYIASFLDIVEKAIAFSAFVSTLFLLFISTTYLEYTYFRGKDVSLWKLLPIKKSEFFLARFIASYFYSLMANVLVTLPLIACVFYFLGFSLYTVISSLIVFFFLPILPLVISSLIVTVKVYLLKGKSIKVVDFLLNNAPFLASVLYLSYTSNKMIDLLEFGVVNNQILAYESLIQRVGSLPYFSLIGKMFFSFSSLILFIFLSFFVFILSYNLISPLFEKCLNFVNESNNNSQKKKKKGVSSSSTMEGSSIIVTLIKREFLIISGEKGFLSESIGEVFIPIILIGVWALTGTLNAMSDMMILISQSSFFIPGILVVIHLFSSMVLISSTSVSREGTLFKLNKILPLKVKQVVLSKVLFHLLFLSIIQVVFLIVFVLFLKAEVVSLLWMIPLFILNSTNISLSGLLIDYNSPKLEWDNAVSAMKRNINGLFGMGFALVVIAPSLVLLFINIKFIPYSFLASLIILRVLWVFVNKAANKAINKV